MFFEPALLVAPLLVTTTAGGIFTATEYKIFYLHVIKYIKNRFHLFSIIFLKYLRYFSAGVSFQAIIYSPLFSGHQLDPDLLQLVAPELLHQFYFSAWFYVALS
tara:strand:+ start:678 stop:989 length:312 start_codon:yes stop_codon:yes gene_type:complete